ncbi:hypothetical protein JCM3770_003786 [Rhodotorula araucariae]
MSFLDSPLGPLHHQPPSAQGSAGRTLLCLLFRRRNCPSTTKAPSMPQGRSPPYAPLDCTFEGSTASTYTPHGAEEPTSPPPPYTLGVAGPGAAEEEDLVVLGEHEVVARSPFEDLKVESQHARSERLTREKLERKRARLLADNARIAEELERLGF